jgi:hypothetical protein
MVAVQTLLDYKSNTHTQCGEDGVIDRVFSVIGEGGRLCCEFGAWDGIYLSNTRSLIERGWTGVLIESDPERFLDLQHTYPPNSRHMTINATVETEGNTLGRLLGQHGVSGDIDFLSIDVDGEDYYIFKTLDVRPRLICIEAIYANRPDRLVENARTDAVRAIGQPLALFAREGQRLGYRLIGMTGTNAFFLRVDAGHEDALPTLTPLEAYQLMTRHLDDTHRIWLYLMGLERVSPWFRFDNPWASRRNLGIPLHVAIHARWRHRRHHSFPPAAHTTRFVTRVYGVVGSRARRLLLG